MSTNYPSCTRAFALILYSCARAFSPARMETLAVLIATARPDLKAPAFLAFCPRCQDRVLFKNVDINEVFCTCTFASAGRSTNRVRLETIRARVSNHKCGASCVHAKGPLCECSCGGRNHGIGWSAN